MPDQEIQIILRNDTLARWQLYDNNEHILAQGEPAAVWKARLDNPCSRKTALLPWQENYCSR